MQIFDFRPQSPDYVKQVSTNAGIIPDRAGTLSDEQDSGDVIGIFADDMPQNIVTRVYNYNLSTVVLLGDESQDMIDNLRRTLVPDIVKDIKILKFDNDEKDNFINCLHDRLNGNKC